MVELQQRITRMGADMNRNHSDAAGWVLIVMALGLLLALHEFDLLAVLLPVSLLAGFVIARLRDRETGLADRPKRG
jgi:hypothetical protein